MICKNEEASLIFVWIIYSVTFISVFSDEILQYYKLLPTLGSFQALENIISWSWSAGAKFS